MTADEYADLPAWIRPGSKLAMLSSYGAVMVTVTRITRTQIATRDDKNKAAILRFYREERQLFGSRGVGYEMVGDSLTQLVRRDRTEVVQFRVRDTMTDLASSLRAVVTPRFGKDARTQGELAMERLDQLENLVRAARRKVEGLIDPGGFIAAEYAQQFDDVPK